MLNQDMENGNLQDGAAWILKQRAEIPEALAHTLEQPLPPFSAQLPSKWDVVGVGGSEGSARLLVAFLNEIQLVARLAPVSRFVVPPPQRPSCAGYGLIVFSQGLSPHARLSLAAAEHYQTAIVITSRSEQDVHACMSEQGRKRAMVLEHAPRSEDGGLLRLVGPACSALLGLRAAVRLAQLDGKQTQLWETYFRQIPQLYERNADEWLGRVAPNLTLEDPGFCLAFEEHMPAVQQCMWKWQEALCAPLPRAMDVLSFAHGPFQSIYERNMKILAFGGHSRVQSVIWSKVEQILDAQRHQLITLKTTLDGPASYFDFDAQILPLVARLVEQRKVCLSNWPGKDKDGALYQLDRKQLF